MTRGPVPSTSAAPAAAGSRCRGPSRRSVPHGIPPSRALRWGLVAAFAVHDLEELVTAPASSRRSADAARVRWPGAPPQSDAALTPTRPRAAMAVALVGVPVTSAAVRGARSAGGSRAYQAVLAASGLHAVTHLLVSAVARRRTPGVITAPVVVAPFEVWSLVELRRCGVLAPGDLRRAVRTAPALAPVLLMAHALAWAITRGPSCSAAANAGDPRRSRRGARS